MADFERGQLEIGLNSYIEASLNVITSARVLLKLRRRPSNSSPGGKKLELLVSLHFVGISVHFSTFLVITLVLGLITSSLTADRWITMHSIIWYQI